MSTSLLYHGFGVRDYRYVRTQYVGGGVVFMIGCNRLRALPHITQLVQHNE